jgi:hypothetical protein
VNRRSHTGAGIDDEQRYAVCGLNGDTDVRIVCEHNVCVGPIARTRLHGT